MTCPTCTTNPTASMDTPCPVCSGFTVPSMAVLKRRTVVSQRYAAVVEAHLTRGELLVQRDRARDIAAALEAEVADLRLVLRWYRSVGWEWGEALTQALVRIDGTAEDANE